MMIVQMDNTSAPSSWERAQRLYEKIIELENKRRKSVQARVPSDPNVWQQIRENYEAIILEDHAFSEQHNIEYALWQLHYKRIEEFRVHLNAASAPSGPNVSQNYRGPARPERVTKIRLQFKTFLSEATGFYHDLILKIRSKYGLPLGDFSEELEHQSNIDRDAKKSNDVKKGLISCHRCFIYLGDLARYKGVYGEGESRSREYAAASSYYLQAASLWPSSGNPHHQLAILASYSGDELVALYRYFRSLAVEVPFVTARDNLIVAFEKNRHSYSQLLTSVKGSSSSSTGRGKGKGVAAKDGNMQQKDKFLGSSDMYKTFCIKFVRLNGILFTRTSLETFAEVLTSVSNGLQELLSSGLEEEMNFGADANENALVIVRLVCILIFTVHNSKKETEGQSYAEIVQRDVLVKNSYTAVFELMGHIIDRCVQLDDPTSSYLLPGISVFVEWLACCPDVAAGSETDEKQVAFISNFWKRCISFFNRILSIDRVSADEDGDDSCFSNMSKYDEREIGNRLGLWEDFELRGFLPLLPAQTILDFSRKHSFSGEGSKEREVRMKRILAAGKALTCVMRIDQNLVCFDSRAKKFLIGLQPSDDAGLTSLSISPEANESVRDNKAETALEHQSQQLDMDGEDEDEVIVFKPILAEKKMESSGSDYPPGGGLGKADQIASIGNLQSYSNSRSPASFENLSPHVSLIASSQFPVSTACNIQQHLQPVQTSSLRWSPEEAAAIAGSLTSLNLLGNGDVAKNERQGNIGISLAPPHSGALYQSFNVNGSGLSYAQSKAQEVATSLKVDTNGMNMSFAQSRAPEAAMPLNIDASRIGMPYAQSRALETAVPFDVDVNCTNLSFAQSRTPEYPASLNVDINGIGMPVTQSRAPEATMQYKKVGVSSGSSADSLNVQASLAPSSGIRKSPISRPVRHLGPPPGFNPVPSKQIRDPISVSDVTGGNLITDDYSWLDGYQPQSVKSAGLNHPMTGAGLNNPVTCGGLNSYVNFPAPVNSYLGNASSLNGHVNFPFPGKQAPVSQLQANLQNTLQQQQLLNGNQQYAPISEQYQGQSPWTGRYFV